MQKKISLKVLPSEAADPATLHSIIAKACSVANDHITGFHILKQSIDARSRQQVGYQLTVQAFIDEPYEPVQLISLQLKEVHRSVKKVIVVGAGPAGLFTALRLIEHGIKPI